MKNNLNIKNKNKKFLGLGIGALVLAGAIGVAGYSTAKANQEVGQSVQYGYSSSGYDVVEFSDSEIDNLYKNLRVEFDRMTFEDQKSGIIDLLNYGISTYTEEGEISLAKECKESLDIVNAIQTSEELSKIVDQDETLLNFLCTAGSLDSYYDFN